MSRTSRTSPRLSSKPMSKHKEYKFEEVSPRTSPGDEDTTNKWRHFSAESNASVNSDVDVEHVSPQKLSGSFSFDNGHETESRVARRNVAITHQEETVEQEMVSRSPQKKTNTPGDREYKKRETPRKSPKSERKSKKRGSISAPSHGHGYFGVHVFCASCVLALLLIVAIVIVPNVTGGPTKQGKTAEEASELTKNFMNNFSQLKKSFPGLSQRFWGVSGSSMLAVVQNPTPSQPAVIMIVNPPGRHNQGRDLALQLSRTYPAAKDPVVINSTDYKSTDPDEAKLKIDQLLTDGFETGSKAAVIHRLEELPPPAILIFYKYCDHENAPYKDAVVIFTVNLPHHLSEDLNAQEQEDEVQKFLGSKWGGHQDLDVNKISALFSRIANSVAIVNTEYNPNPQI